eukprot:XP_020397757.1 uncharacterized protein LOC109941378 [Zea mays]
MAHRGASVLRSRRHHDHLGVITPRDTSSSNSNSSSSHNSKSDDRHASRVTGRASSPSAPKVTPPPPDTRPTDGSGSRQQESAEGGAGGPPPAAAKTAPAASHTPAGEPAAAAPASGGISAVEEVSARGSTPTPDTWGDAGGASSSNPPLTLEKMEVLSDTGAAILREWEALEDEHQHLSDWRTQLEERTRTASQQFISKRSQLERDRKEYKRDLMRVCARDLEASRRENKTLEAQRAQQVKVVERLQKWQQELEGKASDTALAEENLKAKERSLDRRETDLARRETNLVFRKEMLTRWGELLAEHELKAKEKVRKLEEQIHQFNAA